MGPAQFEGSAPTEHAAVIASGSCVRPDVAPQHLALIGVAHRPPRAARRPEAVDTKTFSHVPSSRRTSGRPAAVIES
jgi:hypothetical protein